MCATEGPVGETTLDTNELTLVVGCHPDLKWSGVTEVIYISIERPLLGCFKKKKEKN